MADTDTELTTMTSPATTGGDSISTDSTDAAGGSTQINDYGASEGRLSTIVGADCANDDSKLVKMYIVGDDIDGLVDDLINIQVQEKTMLQAVLSQMQSGYTNFSVTSISDSREEKMQLMPLAGDNFIATFSGRRPHVMGISGYLIFDHDSTKVSWFHAFINAYDSLIRASRMAKHRCKLKLVFPDSHTIIGYMTGCNANQQSDSDSVIQFSASILVIDKTFAHPIGEDYWKAKAQTTTTKKEEAKDAETTNKEVASDPEAPPDVANAEEYTAGVMSTEEYDRYNTLYDQVQNGDELSEEEYAEYQALDNKQNNQGPAYKALQLAQTTDLAAKETAGTITQDEKDQLRDIQERQYWQLSQLGVLNKDQQATYDALNKTVGPEVLLRNLEEKASTNTPLSEWEAIKLRDLRAAAATGNTAAAYNSSATGFYDSYNPVAIPTTPAAQATILAGALADNASYKLPTVKPDKALSTEKVQNKVASPATPTNINSNGILTTMGDQTKTDCIRMFRNTHPDRRYEIQGKIDQLNTLLTTPPPGVDRQTNNQVASYAANDLAFLQSMKSQYDIVYGWVDGTDTTKAYNSSNFIRNNLDKLNGITIPTLDDLYPKYKMSALGAPATVDRSPTFDSALITRHNAFMGEMSTVSTTIDAAATLSVAQLGAAYATDISIRRTIESIVSSANHFKTLRATARIDSAILPSVTAYDNELVALQQLVAQYPVYKSYCCGASTSTTAGSQVTVPTALAETRSFEETLWDYQNELMATIDSISVATLNTWGSLSAADIPANKDTGVARIAVDKVANTAQFLVNTRATIGTNHSLIYGDTAHYINAISKAQNVTTYYHQATQYLSQESEYLASRDGKDSQSISKGQS